MTDVGDFSTAQFAHISDAALQDIASVEVDLTVGDFHTTTPVGHRRKADCGFASAGFTDKAEDLAAFDIEVHAMHNGDVAGALAGGVDSGADFQAAYFEQLV